MTIAVIGGGLTGLTAAYELGKHGHRVTVFEKDGSLGGLAGGFQEKDWDWPLEKSYHHLFANDATMFGFLDELGLADKLIMRRPITATIWHGTPYQMDSPTHLLRFPGLPFTDRLRTGIMLAGLKLIPFVQPLEGITAQDFLRTYGGDAAWRSLWQPLMEGKFSMLYPTVAASWFWARIKKRTPQLVYINGGFQTVISALEQAIKRNGGKIYANAAVTSIRTKSTNDKSANIQIEYKKFSNNLSFDIRHLAFENTLLTVPTPVACTLMPQLKESLSEALQIPHLHAQTLILETDAPIVKGVYWLNITDRSFPFLAVVAHTNFMDKKYYGGHHLTYFGNYLPPNHPYLSLSKEQLLKKFLPFIKRLNPSLHLSDLLNCRLFIGYYAQPVHGLHYLAHAPKLTTLVKGLYFANMDSIFPWDRGTNYAVELGLKAAKEIVSRD